jgi:hypothetical protein
LRKVFVDLENKIKQVLLRQGGGDNRLLDSLRDELE